MKIFRWTWFCGKVEKIFYTLITVMNLWLVEYVCTGIRPAVVLSKVVPEFGSPVPVLLTASSFECVGCKDRPPCSWNNNLEVELHFCYVRIGVAFFELLNLC